jgi:hypothetical protein
MIEKEALKAASTQMIMAVQLDNDCNREDAFNGRFDANSLPAQQTPVVYIVTQPSLMSWCWKRCHKNAFLPFYLEYTP